MFKLRAALVGLVTASAFALLMVSGASATSTGTLSCQLSGGGTPSIGPNGDYTLSPGDVVNCTISGAKSLPNGAVNVYVKHGGSATTSNYQLSGNNEVVPGTYSGGTITFTYDTAGLSTCNTAALSYNTTMGAMKNNKGASSTFTYGSGFSCTTGTPPPAASALIARGSGSAAYARSYTWGITKSVDKTSASYTIGRDSVPSFHYTVTVTHSDATDSGWGASGTITAANPNTADVPNVSASIADSNCSVSGGAQTAPANGNATWNYSCSYSAAGPSSLAMTISWPGESLSDGSVLAAGSASASASLDWSNPTTVNDGSVSVTDNAGSLGTVSASDASPQTITYDLSLDGTAGGCSDFTNTASISGSTSGNLGSDSKTVTVCAFNPPTVDSISASDPGTESYTRTYGWNITKNADSASKNIPAGGSASFHYTVSVSHDNGTDSGWTVTGQIVADNPNSVDVNGLTASVGDSNCSVSNNPQTAPAGGQATFDYSCSFSSTPPSSLALSVSWATQPAGAGTLAGGESDATQPLDWSTPTSIVNGSVDVTDSQAGDLGNVAVGGDNPTTLGYDKSFSGVAGTCTSYPNVASLSTGETASASVSVCVGSDLLASANSGTSFTRTYAWGISKQVNGSSLIEKIGGGTGSFSYTVTVTHDAGTDSAWQAAGTITLTNPNDWETINANVSDAIDNGGTCTVAGGGSVSLAPGQTTTIGYTCSYSAAPTSSSGTDTVTVTWDNAAASTPTGSASATAAATFGSPTTIVNGSTNVSDSLSGDYGSSSSTLGSLSYTSASPRLYTYSRSFAVPTSNCKKENNTAALSVNGQSASASVEACGPAAAGALSMGFWSNKNGQAIITGQGTTNCPSGTWLRTFAPFQDLAAGASCSAVNTYVQNVIKAANASGAAMNAMLKGQMLAVALDVYFSDPSLGGNKIGAPAPIGGLTIDLTHVGLSAENTSGGFGANSMTIAQMLTYAAGKSNAGGTTWYAQVKATQGLAKDAFDAICNSLVYAP